MREKIEVMLYELTAAKAKVVRAEIDAGACGTRRDYNKLETATQAYDETFNRILDALSAPTKS